MAGDTNVHADDQAFVRLVSRLFDTLENAALRDTSKEKQLRDALMKDLFPDGVDGKMAMKAEYHIVPKEFIRDIKAQLEEQNIPYLCTLTSPDKGGDYMILVGENHADDFLQIQQDVYSRSTKFARQSTAPEMYQRARRLGEDHIISVEFENELAANKFQQMLFDNGIVCSELKLGDITKFYVDADSLVKGSKDLVTAELNYSIDQSLRDYFPEEADITDAQAEYDDRLVMDFAKRIKDGGSGVLGDVNNLRNASYLSCKNGDVMLHYMENGNKMELPIKIEQNATISQIQATISKHARGIHDKILFDNVGEWQTSSLQGLHTKIADKFEGKLRPTVEEYNRKYRALRQEIAFESFVHHARRKEECVLGDFNLEMAEMIPGYNKNKSYLSAKDGNIYYNTFDREGQKNTVQIDLSDCSNKDQIVDRIKALTYNEKDKKYDLEAFTVVRGIDTWEKQDIQEIQKNIIDDIEVNNPVSENFTKELRDNISMIMEAVSYEAGLSTFASMEETAKLSEKYATKKEYASQILRGDKLEGILANHDIDPAILEQTIGTGSKLTVREFLLDAVEHFDNTAEKSENECIVTVEKLTKNVKSRMEEEQNRSDGKYIVEKQEEKEKEEEREHDAE